MIRVWRGTATKSQIFYKDVRDPGSSVVELISGFDASYSLVGNDDSVLWLQTDRDAPLGRMIAVDLKNPSREHWKTLIPESTDVLGGINVVGDHFIAQYLHDATALVRLFDLQGQKVRDVELPGPGTVEGFDGWRTDRETFYSFSSYTTLATIYAGTHWNGNAVFKSTDAIASLLETISPLTRLPILLAIGTGEACVCHLEAALGLRQAYISQHLMWRCVRRISCSIDARGVTFYIG